MGKNLVCGVVVGVADSRAKAAKIAKMLGPCPYCALFKNEEGLTAGIFVIPENLKWWLECVQERPRETFGMARAKVFFTEQMGITSPYSRGEVEPVAEIAPCGANCRECSSYKKKCEGCPATEYYIPDVY